MSFHVVLSRSFDFETIEKDARDGARPRHALKQLANRLNAVIQMPADERPGIADAMLGRLIGGPRLWAFAQRVAQSLRPGDVVYCPDEQIGLPLAAMCHWRRNGASVTVMVHNVNRPRAKLALRLLASGRAVRTFFSVAQPQLGFLRDHLAVPADRAIFIADQTDLRFFHPGPQSPGKIRPMIASAGLELRDYRVLAAAAGDLDVDVCLTGFSADAPPSRTLFPDEWPGNFSRRRYEWPELAQLYRDADAVVVTLAPSIYASGVTTMLEGMASGRPVIVTRTQGLEGYLNDTDALTLIDPSDPAQLRQAILNVLADPELAAKRGDRAAQIAAERYGSETAMENTARVLEQLHKG